MEQKFYKCAHCGNIISKVKDSGVPVVCCGQIMQEIVAGEVEASLEKHIPEYKIENNKVIVNVGSIEHPMTEEHFIEWIVLQTKFGSQMVKLNPNEAPKADFAVLNGDEVEAVYAYCNLHGLWKK